MELKNHIDIYPDAVLIDGHEVMVIEGGVFINDYANKDAVTAVTLDLLPKSVTVHQDKLRTIASAIS